MFVSAITVCYRNIQDNHTVTLKAKQRNKLKRRLRREMKAGKHVTSQQIHIKERGGGMPRVLMT
jgi:hypothetical protein